MIDIRQTHEYADYLKREGWIVERTRESNYFIRKLPVIGSILKIQRPEEIRIDIINRLSQKYRIFQIVVEPRTDLDAKFLSSVGFKLAKKPYLPSKTLQIDLTKDKNSIFKAFKKDARYGIRKGREIKIKEYSTLKAIKKFREGWKESVNLRRYVPNANRLINLRKSFPQNKSLFLASHNMSSTIIGGAIFTRSLHDRVYYWYGFTSKEGRASLSQYSLLYQGILWAKRQGCKVFDFEGVYDPRFPDNSWLGFSHFKKSFGGYEVSYPGCFIKNQFLFT